MEFITYLANAVVLLPPFFLGTSYLLLTNKNKPSNLTGFSAIGQFTLGISSAFVAAAVLSHSNSNFLLSAGLVTLFIALGLENKAKEQLKQKAY